MFLLRPAHLYNESARSGPSNFDHYPWEKLTAVAVYTGVGNDTNGTDSVLLTVSLTRSSPTHAPSTILLVMPTVRNPLLRHCLWIGDPVHRTQSQG